MNQNIPTRLLPISRFGSLSRFGAAAGKRLFYAMCSLPILMSAQWVSAASLTFPTAPLYLSATVTPNIMLLVDNSGSMTNIIWENAYNPSTDYTNYSPSNCGNNSNSQCWDANDGNILLQNLPKGNCSDNYVSGRNGRCLRLPDPVLGGNTRYTGNYLNYLFQNKVADNRSADIRTTIPTDYRIQVARDVAKSIINANPSLRFGIAAFNPPVCTAVNNRNQCIAADYGPGGKIVSSCGTDKATVLTSIDNLKPETNTPLAETFYEITRYFRGLSSYYNSGVNYTSPIQYRCQKNFSIVITDGFPTRDTQFPTNDPADPTGKLPNWDGKSPATTASQYPDFPQYSDGFSPNSSVNSADESAEASTLFLDDLVKFGYDIDLSSTYTGQQRLETYTVGFAVSNQMLSDAATYGTGSYFKASDKASLLSALQDAINDIVARTSSATAVALNSSSLNAGTLLFQAKFNSADWSGDISGIPVSTGQSGSDCGSGAAAGTVCSAAWSAGSKLTSRTTDRSIYTYKPGTRVGTSFAYDNLDTAQQNLLKLNPESLVSGVYTAETSDANARLRLAYLAGSRTNEASTATPRFRERNSLLGDIIDSAPFFVATPPFAYDFDSYATFRRTNAARTKAVYVGANDGMLHAFDASTGTSGGTELFAYVPSKSFGTASVPKLALLTKQVYDNHLYTVNGAPVVGDAYIDTTTTEGTTKVWKSVLVGSMRSGGQGLFALDVTNPSAFDATKVLWEFTDANDPDLGYTFSEPSIVRMANGRWAAIVGNGYNNTEADGQVSTDGQAALFIIFLDHKTGTAWTENTDYIKIKTGAGSLTSPNGLAEPAAVDVNGDNKIDYIYAGDQLGNMWRFDVRSTTATDWKTTAKIRTLFQATSSSGAVQQITTRPEVGYNLLQTGQATQGLVVYFGTGSYIASGDGSATDQPTQSFYGIFDRTALRDATQAAAATADTITRSVLQQQQITAQVNQAGGACTTGSSCFRLLTQNSLDIATKRGWYMDLIVGSSTDNLGERQVTKSVLRNGRMIFTTLLPSSNPCDAGGSSWLIEVDAKTGGRLAISPLDTNNDGTFSDGDLITVTNGQTSTVQAPAGLQSQIGLFSSPTILQGVGNVEYKLIAGTNNQADDTGGSGSSNSPNNNRGIVSVAGPSTARSGRISWREITP